ncbi:MAG TPA: polysaccharide biosynthesis C-terminal domain-containing protein [Terracidiphilus sp.]|jgi:O-antigen/teichoic acid export membrane protein|nr:polysaccharide biosynthesis C-terminal domain-containing protein [Terracidiphilus sp.]
MSTVPIEATANVPVVQPSPRSGFRAVVQSVGSKSAILVLQAGTGILTARTLGPAGRGELAAMILWPLFVASVTTLGVPSSLIYYLRNQPAERDRLIANGFVMAAILGVLSAAIAAGLLPWWLRQYSPGVIHAAQLFLVTVPLCSVTLAGRAVLEAEHDFAASNGIQILTPLVTLAGLLLFFAFHPMTPMAAAFAYIAASVPAFAWMARRVARTGFHFANPQSDVVRKILQYGVRSYGVDILGTLALQVDQVLVVSLLSASAMGSYVVVLSLSRMLNVFQTSVVMVLFPKAAGHDAKRVLAMTGDAVRISGLVTAACGAAVCLAGPIVLRVLYGPAYVAAAGALRILVLEAVLSGITFVLAQAFMALNRPGVVTILQGLGLSLSIPLMLLLIPRYGIYGAAIALLASTCARVLFVCIGFKVFLKTAPPRLVPAWRDLQMLMSACSRLVQERAA